MLFDRPHASCTNNIIYIDRPNNCKTILEVICTIFCFLKITSFHKPHNNFKTLPLPSKLQREKWQENLSQILDPLLFSDVFPAPFFRDSSAENRRIRIPAVSRIKLKFTQHAHQNAPSASLSEMLCKRNNSFPRSLGHFQSLVPKLLNVFVPKLLNVFCCLTWSFIPCWFWRELLKLEKFLALTLMVDVDVGSNLICWILHHYGTHRRILSAVQGLDDAFGSRITHHTVDWVVCFLNSSVSSAWC